MKHIWVIACALVGTLGQRGGPAAQPSADTITVRIVPTSFRERVGRAIELYRPTDHFHVVITNASDGPVRLWRDWCSWGYFCLSFEVIDARGKSYTVKKKARGWDKNYPDEKLIPSGDHMVLEVAFDDSTWEGGPSPVSGSHEPQVLSIQAVYEVRADPESEKQKIWTGKVTSPRATYSIYR
jgi:hypothetical protein